MVEMIAVIAIISALTLLAMSTLYGAKDKAREANAKEKIRDLEKSISSYALEKGVFPDALTDLGQGVPIDPWGHAYVYANLANGDAPLTDADGVTPVNTDFDLYSQGIDGGTGASIADGTSGDNVIRANTGSYVGLAKDY